MQNPLEYFHGEPLSHSPRLTDEYLYASCELYEEMCREPDTVRVLFPVDINKEIILSKLKYLIYRLGDVSWKNETEYSCETHRLIEQVEIYDYIWKQNHGIKEGHSAEATELMKEFVKVLRGEVLDGDECYPFEVILEISKDYGLGITEENLY